LDLVLDLRTVQAYIAGDGDDVVLVLVDDDGCGVELQPGMRGSCQAAVDGAVRIGRMADEYAALLRMQAQRRAQQ
jgi:hypothetical protein